MFVTSFSPPSHSLQGGGGGKRSPGTPGVMPSFPVGKNTVHLSGIITSLPVCDITSCRETYRTPARYSGL